MAMIEVEALDKTYRGGRGLHGFSFRLESNELVGLVGPNGAGKTTLIKILATLIPATSGKAHIGGHDVATEPHAVRAVIGYLPDVAGIYQDLRVKEFLEFFADAFRLKEPKRSAAIQRALELSGLKDRDDEYVENLSLGWKQRLLLAKTLLHEPKILLLDEPATGLDPLARISLREQLKRLHSEGVAILISSHILSDLEDMCTRILFIADGKNVSEPGASALPAGIPEARIQCEIGFRGSPELVNQAIAKIPSSRILERRDGFLLVEIPGGPAEASSLLRAILNSGMVVEHFDARGPGLEERYRRAFGERLS
jgi:ABC-2 type transport system ATP-binding protein